MSTLTAHPHVTAAEEQFLRAHPGPVVRHIACPISAPNPPSQSFRSWGALASQTGTSPFLLPTWIDAWVSNHCPDARVEVLGAKSGDTFVGALPVVRESTWLCGVPVRRLRPPFSLQSPDPYELQAAADAGPLAAEAIWSHLDQDRSWDVLELVDVPATGAIAALITRAEAAGYLVGRRPSRSTPYLDLTAITDPCAHTTSKFRANLRRRRRNLEARGSLHLVRHDDLTGNAMSQFLDLEHAGWKGREGTSILSSATDTTYHCALARAAAAADHLAIYSLELDGRPIAMHFGLVFQNRYLVPKLAYAEDMHEFAPGHILVHDVLEDLLVRGIAEFDFLGNQMDWKREWTPLTREYERVHIFNRTTCGLAAAKVRYALLPRARSLRTRLAANTTGRERS